MASMVPVSDRYGEKLSLTRQVSTSAEATAERLALIEAGRGGAACFIVAHHLSAYGTAPVLAAEAAPELLSFLYDYARMAVQVFLVFGGFSLGWMFRGQPVTWVCAGRTFAWRYIRLTIPLGVMLALLLGLAWLTHNSHIVPPLIDSFSWPQLLAHFAYLQDVLGYGNLSAGTWYLCIDMQFTALFLFLYAGLQAVCSRVLGCAATPLAMSLVLMPLGLGSAWYWNRLAEGDSLVPYFLAPLVLGVLVAWALCGKLPFGLLVVYIAGVALSLGFDEVLRIRLMVALATALALLLAAKSPESERLFKPLAPLGRISYSLFLIHYLVSWLVLAALGPWVGSNPGRALLALVVAFAASLVAATGLYCLVEKPALHAAKALKP